MKRLRRLNARACHTLFFAVACVAMAASCDLFTYKRPFDDAYYDDNFIASIGFGNFATAPGTDSANPPTGRWDFAYRYDKWDGVEYMTLAAETDPAYATAGASGFSGDLPSGLASASFVYRLELVNMVTGGDFEGGPGTWSISGLSSLNLVSFGGINNRTIQLNLIGNDTNRYRLVPVASMMREGGAYVATFRWKGESPKMSADSYIRMNDEATRFEFNTTTFRAYTQFTSKVTSGDDIVFHIGWTDSFIDDLTVKKANAKHQLRLLLRKEETKPALEDFQYIFSFWVHADPSVAAFTSPYHLDRLGIQMYPTPTSTLSSKPDPDYAYSPADIGWKRMSVKIDNGNLQMTGGTADPVLELIVDLDNSLPGRILIAQPELRAYPDGY